MQGAHTHLRAYLGLLLVLILAGGFLCGLYAVFGIGAPAQTHQAQALPQYPSNLPPLTAEDAIAEQQSAHYLVSYTISGFHPTSVSINKGQSIRFINDAFDTIELTEASDPPQQLQQGAYFDYVASKGGTFTFKANDSEVAVTVAK